MERLKILVVDDEPGMRAGVARALRDYRFALPEVNGDIAFAVSMAESGEQAIEMVTESSPDIILLDHKLPGISGLEALDRIRAIDPGIMAVMITAYASLETAVSAVKRGAYDFLAKPFTPDELKNTVRKASESLILARQARRLAQEKRQVRFQFVSVLAHELKAPLSAIEGYLHIVKDRAAGDDPAVYEHMVARCLIRAEYMRKMIADLLDLTRIESGTRRRELTEVDLSEAARMAVESAAPVAAERDITVEIHGGGGTLTADRAEMDIVLNNLVSNAVKYNRDGGRVDVTLAADEERVSITVADTGIGMSAEESARLFGDFVRIKNDKTRNILGSGLGLSIVKKLAVLYGGDVTVSSEPDRGSTFVVTLRRTPEGEDREAVGAASSGGESCERR